MRLSHPPKLLAVFFASMLLIVLNFRFIHLPAESQPAAATAQPEQEIGAGLALTGPEEQAAEASPIFEATERPTTPVEPEPPASSPAQEIPQAETALSDPALETTQAEPAPAEAEVMAAGAEAAIAEAESVPAGAEALIADAEAVEAGDSFSEVETAGIVPETEAGAPATGFGLLDPTVTDAQPIPASTAGLDQFVQQVANGNEAEVRGVYVEGTLALPIVKQPSNDVGYVSMENGTATLFQNPLKYGVVGLLAHNFLSGNLFYKLKAGQEIVLVYGAGRLRRYQVTNSANFERLTRSNLRSNFQEIETGATFTADEVFERFYKGDHHITLQTCIERDGIWNWGVRFIVAEPVEP